MTANFTKMDNAEKQLVQQLNQQWGLVLKEGISIEETEAALAAKINDLIQNDFPQLISLLYRIDVNETKLRHFLREHPEEEGAKIIAGLIIERQQQKIKTRQLFSNRDNNISEEEKW